jgi:cobalamin biosynthesis Co2+ chelatase CbiK
MRYTIHDAEQTLQYGHPDEDTLKRYSVDILQELCTRRNIKIDEDHKGLRRLKRPYIDALLRATRVSSQSLFPADSY